MATILNIEEKYEGSSLTASEFNAVVTAINENAISLEEVYNEITGNLKITEIVVQASPRQVYTIDSVEALINYLKLYGTATPTNNTAPIIRLKRNTYIYKEIDSLNFEIDLYDLEGGDLKLIGENPLVTGGYNTFVVEGLRTGVNTINLNELIYRNTSDKLPIGIYDFKNIYVVDKLNRSSITPVNIKIIIGSIELTSAFDSGISYPKNTGIGVRYFVSSVINSVSITYRLSGKYLTLNEHGEYEVQTYPEKVDKLEGQKLIALDENFIVGSQYSVIRTLDAFSNIGDYTLTIQVQGEGEYSEAVSNLLSINVVVNENGFLYSSSNFDIYQQYYAGDSVDIPVNIYYTESPDVDYLYQVEAWIDNLGISVTSNETSQQKNIPIKLVLPDDADTYTVKYRSTIITPLDEVYETNTNFVVIPAKQKSKYAVITDPSSKLELYLTAKGKSNSQDNYTLWNNRYNLDQNYYGLLYNINPDTMGWEEKLTSNQHKGDALYTNSIAYASVNYYPFQDFTNNSTGLTIDFSIRHENAVGPDLFNLSIGNPEITPKKGIFVRDNKVEVIVGSEMDISVPVICERRILSKRSGNWEDGDEYAHITITFNTANKQVYIYLNGVISGYGEYATNSTLDHSFPIIIGATLDAGGLITGYADTKVRFIRVYKSVLTPIQVVNNYIASFPSDDDRVFLEKLNDEISPVLSTSYMKGNRVGIVKDDPRQLEFSFIPGLEEEISSTYIPEPLAVGNYSQEYMDMKLPFPVDVDLQGNSSLSYPVNNYGIDIYDAEAYSATGSLVSKDYTMVYNELANNEKEYPWPKWDSYHLKANYIDSSHCNNLIMAKLSEQVFRFPYNWVTGSTLEYSSIFPGYVGSFPFKTFTTVDNNGVSDPKSRFPVYPYRLSVDGFPFIMYGDFRNANSQLFEKRFIGLYTWNLKQHRKLYSMKKESEDPNRRYFIYRCESNGDSVHEQLRSGYCKFIDMTKQTLLVDSYDRILSPTYIYSQEEIEMLGRYPYDTFSWYPLISESGYLQPNGKYTWIKFATSREGSNLGNEPSGKSFIGYAFNKNTSVKSNNPLDYTWSVTSIYNSIDNLNGTHSIIRYSAVSSGENMSSNIDGKNFIGFKYDAIKNYWQEGVDYFDKTGDPDEMKWRAGAELIMDWECREPDDMGVGHWEEFVNGEWIKTLNIISPRDLDINSTGPDKILRFVWDRINSSGDATRTGATRVDWWPSILNSNLSIPSRDNPGGTIIPVDKIKGEAATELHIDFLNAINWLYNATDEAFSKPEIFEKYFDLRTSLDYVLCCLTFALTDSIGRNLTMISWDQDSHKIAPGIMDRKPMRFYPVFYDIDTAFGTNVQGGLYSRPDFDWPYVIGMGEQTYTPPPNGGQEYNCFGSQFFERISKNYGRALARRYAELRSGGTTGSSINLNAPFDYNNILRLYNNQMVGRIGERYFNEDAVYKYIGYGTDDPDIVAKRNYITNARGNKVMFMKNFLRRRLNFIDAMLGYFPDTDDMAYFQHYYQGLVTLRLESSTSTTVRISFAQNNSRSISLRAGEITEVQFTYSDTTQHIMRIYNCATITRLEGLNGIDLRVARMNSLLSVRELDLRNNPAIGSIDANNGIIVSDCSSLETLNVSGCNGPTPFSINLDKCYQLKNFIATNSSLSQVSFSGKYNVESIDVRNCPNLLDLSVSGLQKLTDLKLDHEVLTSLNLSQSKVVLDLSLPNLFPNLTTLNIVENSGFVTLKFDSTSFPKLSNLIIRNCSKLEVVEDLFMDRLNPVVLNTEFLANCPKLWCIKNLFKNSLIQTIPSRMLENSTDRLTCMTGVFQGCTSLVTIPEAVLSRDFPLLENITDIFNGTRLQRYVDKFITVAGNPVKIGLDPINVFQSNNIFNNAPALKDVTRAFYGAELVNVPTNLFQNSILLETINECFSNINNTVGNAPNGRSATWLNGLLIPENLFAFSRNIKYADKVFKNTTIARVKTTNSTTNVSSISDNIFQSHLILETAKELFKDSNLSKIPTNIFGIGYDLDANEYPSQIKYLDEAFANTDITQIPEGVLSNLPELLSLDGIFAGDNITTLPAGFLLNTKLNSFKFGDLGNTVLHTVNSDILSDCVTLTDISNLCANTNISILPDYIFSNNPNIHTITDFYLNSTNNISSIGRDFLFYNSVISIANLFGNLTIKMNSIGDNFMYNSPQLTNVYNAFTGFGSEIIGDNLLFNCPSLTSIEKMFEDSQTNYIGDYAFKGSTSITNAKDVFLNSDLVSIGREFIQTSSTLTNISGLFKGATLFENLGENSLVNLSALTTAEGAFENTFVSTLNSNILSNCPELLNISNIFYNTQLTGLPLNFLDNSVKVNNMNNLFTGGIVNIPDNFGLNNTGIISFAGIFGPNIETIGNNVFKGAIGLGSLNNALFGKEFLTSIGDGFLENSNATSANNLFWGCINLISVGENFAKNSKITSADSCFRLCTSLTNVAKTLFEGSYITSVESMFDGCYNLTGDLVDLGIQNYFKNCPNITNFDRTFYNCSILDSVTPTRDTDKLWEVSGLSGDNCFFGCINLKDYSDPAYGGPIPLLWGGPVTTTLNITSSQAQTIGITNIVITEGYNYEKITNTQYKIYSPSNATLNITITDTGGTHASLNTQIAVGSVNQTVGRQLTYIPLRSIYVKIYSLGTAIEGASVTINGITYTTDVNGLVSVRTGGTLTVSVLKDSNYNTINTTYDPSLIDTSNNIFLKQAKSILFTVYNGTTSAGLEGATVYFPEVSGQSTELTATTNSSGQVSIVRFIGDTYTYRVSKTGFYYKEVYNFTVTSDTNTVQATLNEDWASKKPANPNGRVQMRINYPGSGGNNINYSTTSPVYINWGDGSAVEYLSSTGSSIWKGHTYSSAGDYEIEMWSTTSMTSITMLKPGDFKLIAYWDIGNSNITFTSTYFRYRRELKYVGDVFKNSTITSFEAVFQEGHSLLSVHPDIFSHHPEVTSFKQAFHQCFSLTEIPPTLFANNTSATNFDSAFWQCHSLTSIPEGLFAATSLNVATNIFAEAYSLRVIPNNLFSGFTGLTSLESAFKISTNKVSTYSGTPQSNLIQFPTTLVTGTPLMNVVEMFKLSGVTNTTLVGPVIDLWTSSLPGINSYQCFNGWTNASNYATIPSGWK